MTPKAAIGILTLAIPVIWMGQDRLRRYLALGLLIVPALIGLETLLLYASGIELKLNYDVMNEVASASAQRNPAPETAICLLTSSAALWMLALRRASSIRASQILALIGVVIPILALTGYFSGVETLYSLFVQERHIGMALLTAVALLSISIAILLSTPSYGFMSVIASPTQGGMVARRLVTATLVAPPFVGFFGLLGEESGYLSHGLRLALAPFLGSFVLLFLTWMTARHLDLLDQQRAESERILAANESRLKAILEVAPIGLWWTDAEGKIAHGNTMGHQIWSGTRYVGPEEFGQYRAWWIDTGKPIVPEEWALTRAIQKGEVSIGEQIEIECFDGTHKYILNSAAPFKDGAGRTLGAVAVNLDITEPVRLERKLRLLADAGRALLNPTEFQAAFERIARLSVPEFADWCTIHLGDERGGLKRIAAVYRDSSLESLARRTFDSYSPSPESFSGVYQVLRTGLPVFMPNVEESHLTQLIRDEGFRNAFRALVRSYIMMPLILNGKTIGVFSFVRGESGRRFEDHDLELAQNLAVLVSLAAESAALMQEARLAARAREEVVAIVSHDLRNPVSAVRLAAQAMKRSLSSEVPLKPDLLIKLSENILASSEAMNRLVQDLLDLAKMEAGKFSVFKQLNEVSALMSKIELLYKLLAQEKGIELLVSSPSKPLRWEMDQDRMLQVISNLVGNALKFTPPGGRIELKAHECKGELVLEVADTGRGIAASELPHLFERYWQPKRSRQSGAGLGLFICKGIVEAHGGRIWVESIIGRGARFLVAIPYQQGQGTS